MHGEYKIPGGKLVGVDVAAERGVLRHVRVAGDFFLEPDEALDAVNRALEGAPADIDAAGLAARIDAALPEGTVMYGLTSEGVGIAVRRALSHATDWTDYDWQLGRPGGDHRQLPVAAQRGGRRGRRPPRHRGGAPDLRRRRHVRGARQHSLSVPEALVQGERQWPAPAVGREVDLRGQSGAGPADGVVVQPTGRGPFSR